MANQIRQYIGARYTTKIYTNSLDPSSAEWESGRSWEPLILVTYNNSSYLSKKEIPSSVGNPASNPDYWVCTGYYNGQIASLQSQIDVINNVSLPQIETEIDLQGRHRRYIMITDSYGLRTDAGKTISDILIERGHDIVYVSSVAGASFADTIPNQKFDNHVEDYTGDSDLITDVLFCGSVNDRVYTQANIITAIRQTTAHVKSVYPNAKVTIIPWGVCFDPTLADAEKMYNVVPYAYNYGAITAGAIIAKNAEYMLRDTRLLDSDLLHPNADGVFYVASMLDMYLNGGEIDVDRYYTATPTIVSTDVNTPQLENLVMHRHNGNVTIQSANAGWSFIRFRMNTPASGFTTFNPLFTLDDTLVSFPTALSRGYYQLHGIGYDSSNSYSATSLQLLFNGRDVRADFLGSNYQETYTSFDGVQNTIVIND